jgi:hypothetical protein
MGWSPALLEHVTNNLDHSSIGRPTRMYLFNSPLKPSGKYMHRHVSHYRPCIFLAKSIYLCYIILKTKSHYFP